MKLSLTIVCATVLVCCCWGLTAEENGQQQTAIEFGKARQAKQLVYAPKAKIERPTERLISSNPTPANAPNLTSPSQLPAEASELVGAKAKTEPGKVRWHANFDAACRASRETGKPVLLFQLMGQLDEVFC